MARESTSTTVSPSEEQSTINLFQIFGWELVSSQEVYNKDSHLESRDDGLYNVTSTTHYVKLVFTRETTMPNYAKLVALENEFYNIKMPTYYEPTGSNLLKYERKNAGYTQQKMATMLGITQPSYIRYENGTSEPSLETLAMIADIFDVSVDYLLGRAEI